MDDIKVSVIIPMYNCEEYVDELLRSLSEQSLASFEVICIDDGSTDGTLARAQSFCETDGRFVVLAQEHNGAGAARNTGLEKAQGAYLMFLDADDEYSTDLLGEMVSAAEEFQVDEVFCLFREHNHKTQSYREDLGFNKELFPDRTPVSAQSIDDLYRNTSWWCPNTLFRKELVDQYHLRFSTTQIANDDFFMRAYASVATTMLGLHKHLLTYHRFRNERSLTSGRDKHTEDAVKVLLDLHDWLYEHNLYEQRRDALLNLFIHSINYNGSFPYRPQYVEAVVEALCGRGLIEGMSERAFFNVYWKRYRAERIRKKLSALRAENPPDLHKIENQENLLTTIQAIEDLAKKKFGRSLDPRSKAERALIAARAKLTHR